MLHIGLIASYTRQRLLHFIGTEALEAVALTFMAMFVFLKTAAIFMGLTSSRSLREQRYLYVQSRV